MEEERLPNGLVCHDASLTEDEAIKLYNRDQLLWMRLSPTEPITFSHQTINQQYEQDPAFFSNHFSVENPCQHDPKHLTPSAVFGKNTTDSISTDSGAYYVSSILQRNSNALSRFFESVPFAKAPFLKDAYHDDGAWLFFGYNPILEEQHEDNISNTSSSTSSTISSTNSASTSSSTRGTKRKKNSIKKNSTPPISGRPEHTDKVQHSGTWHVQLSGTKTWYVRPLKSASEWMSNPPNLKAKPGACQKNSSTRLRICVQPGDLLVINTRAWWHQTEIDSQKSLELVVAKGQKKRRSKGKKNEKDTSLKSNASALSISYARDFYLDGKPKKEMKESNSSSEDLNEDPAKTNDRTLDPRLIAKTMVYNGELAVVEEDLPENLPRSRDPNCELCVCEVEGEEMMCMLATRDIYIGEPFSIKVEDDEDADDMEEWELNTTTGEMTRILPEELNQVE